MSASDINKNWLFADLGRDFPSQTPPLSQPVALRPQGKPALDRFETKYFTPTSSPRPDQIALPESALSSPKSSRPSSPMLSAEQSALPDSNASSPTVTRPSTLAAAAPVALPGVAAKLPLGAPIEVTSKVASASSTPVETPIVTPVASGPTTRVASPERKVEVESQSELAVKTQRRAKKTLKAPVEAEAKPAVSESKVGRFASVKTVAAKAYARMAAALAFMVAGVNKSAASCMDYFQAGSSKVASGFKWLSAQVESAYARTVAGFKSATAFCVRYGKVAGNSVKSGFKWAGAKCKAGLSRVKSLFTKKPVVEITTPEVDIKIETLKA